MYYIILHYLDYVASFLSVEYLFFADVLWESNHGHHLSAQSGIGSPVELVVDLFGFGM